MFGLSLCFSLTFTDRNENIMGFISTVEHPYQQHSKLAGVGQRFPEKKLKIFHVNKGDVIKKKHKNTKKKIWTYMLCTHIYPT